MAHYCECGRPIVIHMKNDGKWRFPKDDDHNLCRQCYESEMDSQRHGG